MKDFKTKSLNNERLIKNLEPKNNYRNIPNYKKIYVDTCFGKVRVIRAGKINGQAILIFHEENSTSSFSINQYKDLLKNYLLYICDPIFLINNFPKYDIEYGRWASEIIEGLGYEKMICIGESFGGKIVINLMCYRPDRVEKSILISPYGLVKSQSIKIFLGTLLPKILYRITKKNKFLYKMAKQIMSDKEICNYQVERIAKILDELKMLPIITETIDVYDAAMCLAPTLVIAGENDKLFCSIDMLNVAEKTFFNSTQVLIKNCAHTMFLSSDIWSEVNKHIFTFLKKTDGKTVIKFKDMLSESKIL